MFTFFITVSFAQEKYNCEEMGLKGKVKSIRETQYKLNDINPGLNEILITTFSFNANCRKTSEITSEVGGDPKNRHTVSYDKSGNITSETKQNTAVNGNFTIKYKYDASKKLSKKEVSSNGRIISTYIYHYDNGNVTSMEINKKLGLLDINNEKFEYKYDANNRLSAEIHTEGDEYRRTEYAYDDSNRIIRKVEFNHRGGITYETDYEYDELGNPSSETSNYRGNNINNFSFVYEYDEQGNWINKRSLSNDKTYSLQIRVITYY
jgi:YD repeat-containing protein